MNLSKLNFIQLKPKIFRIWKNCVNSIQIGKVEFFSQILDYEIFLPQIWSLDSIEQVNFLYRTSVPYSFKSFPTLGKVD